MNIVILLVPVSALIMIRLTMIITLLAFVLDTIYSLHTMCMCTCGVCPP